MDIFTVTGCRKSIRVGQSLDNVLQQMFLNFLDVILEDRVSAIMFGCRKGRNVHLAVASVFFKLNRLKFFKNIFVCSIIFKNIFFDILHSIILSRFPFPKKYMTLLKRWLQCYIVDKTNNFKNLGRNQRGISQYTVLGPVIVNYILFTVYQEDIHHRRICYQVKRRHHISLFGYLDNLVVISNNMFSFNTFLFMLEKKLEVIGLYLDKNQIDYILGIKKRVSFNFLGFTFKLIPVASNKKIARRKDACTSLKFKIFLKPKLSLFSEVKIRLKKVIFLIQSISSYQLHKIFKKINSIIWQ
jgi:hypothetical protein